MKITIETITPDVARAMLGHNTANRGLRRQRVVSYADQMARGQWLETGDPIKFAPDGTLLDGQHRLAAVIESGATVRMAVARNVNRDAYRIIDTGLGRTPGDGLGPEVANAAVKAAAARLLYVIECDGDPRKTQDMTAVTRTDVTDYFEEHHEELESAQPLAWALYRATGGGIKAAWMAFIVLARRVNREWADEFCDGLLTGANLSPGDPRLALRNWLPRNKMRQNGGYVGVFVKTWNLWLMGRSRQILSLRDEEEFPTLAHRRKGAKEVAS